ncbi:MAG TPA: sensor histidine kinase [Candidatus Saccharimonadales bacterium]|nr:sensor histidine kinase [Candidatus Saccharimonadales bacterium]
MKPNPLSFSRSYRRALRKHLDTGSRATLDSARGLGSQALATGLQTLDLAKLHEQILVAHVLPGCPGRKKAELIRKAGAFFAMAITPIEKTQRGAREATARLKNFIQSLSERTVELASSIVELNIEITRRRAAEASLKISERHYSKLLEQSNRFQGQLRELSRQILSAQEDERKRISRELHDVIAQTLTGITIRLANLQKDAASNTKGLERNIAQTQELVEHSVHVVHQFARELRPAVLDDLGLIPALHSYLKSFTARTGVRTHLIAFAEVEKMHTVSLTAMYRLAQEALTNVGRHARATQAWIIIRELDGSVQLEIRDDGKGFQPEHYAHTSKNKRLGLLGMRERVEMISGKLTIKSNLGTGTTIQAEIPFRKGTRLNGKSGNGTRTTNN